MWDQYEWIVGVGAMVCFFVAYGIGANDLANAFASSVGSGALTIKQAVLVAAVMEFGGAVGLGSLVSDTVRKGIADYKYYEDSPELFMFGMLAVLGAVAIWLIVATMFELPVSTTHSTVGGVIGFSMAAKGVDSVIWYKKGKPGTFPVGGVSGIILSWVLSPVCSGILGALFYWVARWGVLRRKNSYELNFKVLPIWFFVCITINMIYLIQKGASSRNTLSDGEAVGIAFGVGAACALFSIWLIKAKLRPRCDEIIAEAIKCGEIIQDPENPDKMITDWDRKRKNRADADKARNAERAATDGDGAGKKLYRTLTKGLEEDVHAVVGTDQNVGAAHDNAEVFDARTEQGFTYLQVFTACCDSFSHGANDIANAVGPFAAIWYVYKYERVQKKTEGIENDMYWILTLGGVGLIVGMATYGYNMMRALGVKLTKITPSRGFAIELGSALIIISGSKLKLPLSTTHCQVGSTIGVGMVDNRKAVNWSIVPKIIAGWIFTLIVVGCTAAGFYCMGAYAPSVYGVADRNAYETSIQDFVVSISDLAAVKYAGAALGSPQANFAASMDGLAAQAKYNAKIQHLPGPEPTGCVEGGEVKTCAVDADGNEIEDDCQIVCPQDKFVWPTRDIECDASFDDPPGTCGGETDSEVSGLLATSDLKLLLDAEAQLLELLA